MWCDDGYVFNILQAHESRVHCATVRSSLFSSFHFSITTFKHSFHIHTRRHPSQWVVKTSETPTQVWGRPRTSLSFSTSTSHTRTHTHKQTPTSEREVPDQPPHKRHRSCTQTEEDAGMGGNDDKEDKTSRNRRWWPSPSAWIRLSGEGVKGSVGGGVEVEVEVETTASRLFETLPRCLVEKTALQRAQQLFPNMQPFHLLGSEEVVDVAAINELGIPMLVR